jgi:hypothetical protein
VKRAFLSWVMSLLLLPGVAAAASRVVLLRSAGSDPLPRQAETLLAAELRASGFEVMTRDRSAETELRADIEAAAAASSPIAVLAIATAAGATAEIWLSDRVTGKLVIRRFEAGPEGDPAAALALRAVELLRGSFLEIAIEAPPARPSEPRATPPPEVTRFMAAAVLGRQPYFVGGLGIGLGAAVLGSPSALGATYAPALRLSYGGRGRLCLRLSLMAPGTTAQVPVRDGAQLLGTAFVRQDVALLEGLLAFRGDSRLQPFVGLGAGAHRVRVRGVGASPLFTDREGNSVGAALDAGTGVALRLGDRAALVLELHLLATLPSARISVVDQQAARVGPLTALGALGLSASF